jgi:chromatin remodeling complex protein RSC6
MSSSTNTKTINKTKSSKKAAPVEVPVEVPVEAPAPVPVVPESVSVSEPVSAVAAVPAVPMDVSVAAKFETTLAAINDALNNIKAVQTQVKQMAKDFVKIVKAASKKTRRANAAAGEGGVKKNPSGFAKPTALSPELCAFLDLPLGTELARTDVTRRLTKYIKDNELQDEADKRNIRPDEKLDTILTIPDGKQLTFFNLQSFIKHNFIKATLT